MHKLLSHPAALCNIVRRIAVEAGEITLNYFESPDLDHAVEQKEDGSPVSMADKEAEVFITKALKDIFSDIPVVGEEAVAGGYRPDLQSETYFWLVDPLDGTREFVRGGEDFTVNIALIHNRHPILGVVYAPATGTLYAGHGEQTAIRWKQDSDTEKPIMIRPPPHKGLTIVSSRSHGNNERLQDFLEHFKIQKLLKKGSSLKICAIAEGKADLYPRFGPTCEWDTAAGHAVLTAAGGFLTDTSGKPLTYGSTDPKLLNPEFVAASFKWWEISVTD